MIDFQYQSLGNFKEGLAAFRLTDEQKSGYINTKGEIAIAPQWDAALEFSEGLAAVVVGDSDNLKWGFINKAGQVVIAPKYDTVQPDVGNGPLDSDIGYFHHGIAKVYLEGDKITQITIDKKGNEIQRQIYDSYEDIFGESLL